MIMKKFKYLDITTLYEWTEFKVSPLITFPCKNIWKTNIEYIEGSLGFSGFFICTGRVGLFGLASPITNPSSEKFWENCLSLFSYGKYIFHLMSIAAYFKARNLGYTYY